MKIVVCWTKTRPIRFRALPKRTTETTSSLLRDVQAILELSPDEQLKRFREDPWGAFSGLKAANGTLLPLSREGQKRFTQIANRGLKNLGTIAQDHRLEKVVEALKDEFSSLLVAAFNLSAENAHVAFSSAIRKLEDGYLELTYYVPCSVVAERSPVSFTVGPVTFLLRDQFLKQHEGGDTEKCGRL